MQANVLNTVQILSELLQAPPIELCNIPQMQFRSLISKIRRHLESVISNDDANTKYKEGNTRGLVVNMLNSNTVISSNTSIIFDLGQKALGKA